MWRLIFIIIIKKILHSLKRWALNVYVYQLVGQEFLHLPFLEGGIIFKEKFIKLLIKLNDKIREEKLIQLQRSIEKYIVPIRNFKRKDRKHNLSNKYQNNRKNSF